MHHLAYRVAAPLFCMTAKCIHEATLFPSPTFCDAVSTLHLGQPSRFLCVAVDACHWHTTRKRLVCFRPSDVLQGSYGKRTTCLSNCFLNPRLRRRLGQALSLGNCLRPATVVNNTVNYDRKHNYCEALVITIHLSLAARTVASEERKTE